jgi:methylated-DNA-[protein]-cysteine S-methyltransferase
VLPLLALEAFIQQSSLCYFQRLSSPLGTLVAVVNDQQILSLIFEEQWQQEQKKFPGCLSKKTELHQKLKMQLKEYFQGSRWEFDLPFQLHGTDFQKKVWKSLEKIPYGSVITYSQQAEQLKNPKAVRASARANGANPVCILIPCHRVVGKNGSLTGYAGGLKRKEYLLNLEQENILKKRSGK